MRTRVPFLIIMIVILAGRPAWAEQIMLKTSEVVQGKILEKTPDRVKVDVNGVQVTYFADEVYSIDGEVLAPPVTDAKAPAEKPPAVTQPVVPPAINSVPSPKRSTLLPFRPPETSQTQEVTPEKKIMDKKQLVRQFLTVYGTRDVMTKNFNYMFSKMTPQQASMYRPLFNVDEIIDRLVPLYMDAFTEEELKTYITFYSSPAGTKLMKEVPHIMQKGIAVSAQYFKEKAPQLFPKNPPAR